MRPAAILGNFRSALRRPRWRRALAVALLSDAVSFGLEALSLGLAEPLQLGVDLATAAVLFALLGFRWGMAVPLLIEAVPGAAVFPTWALAVAAYAALEDAPPAPPAASPAAPPQGDPPTHPNA